MHRFLTLWCLLLLSTAALAIEFPPFVDTNGQPATLAGHVGDGRWTIAMLWESNCGVCNAEAPWVEAFYRRNLADGVRVVGISLDGLEHMDSAREFVTGHHLGFPNLVASTEEIATLFYDLTGSVWLGTPTFLVFDPDGELRTYQSGAVPMESIARFIAAQERNVH